MTDAPEPPVVKTKPFALEPGTWNLEHSVFAGMSVFLFSVLIMTRDSGPEASGVRRQVVFVNA